MGGRACYSWGSYDKDDTFANFSNYGADVDLIAPGKCILSTVPGGYGLLSGTSMAAPHVTAAAALYKSSRPTATPAQVRSALRAFGNQDWKQSTDPDGPHEPLLDVSRIVLLGDFAISAPSPSTVLGPAGGSRKSASRRSAPRTSRTRSAFRSTPTRRSAPRCPTPCCRVQRLHLD